ncbi:MAG: metallophosphoesterase [Henriciella sp.]|nr:metallophosphoesterase [Henriciella sp.]
MKSAMIWGAYIWFPFVLACAFGLWKFRGRLRFLIAAALVLSLPLAWARFVEPKLLFVKETSIDLSRDALPGPSIRVALVADMHYGVFTNSISMERIVRRINRENVDAVFVAGDFLYQIYKKDVSDSLAALSDLTVPIFAVRGNHDVGFPGPIYGEVLTGALEEHGVLLIENMALEVELGGHPLIVAGTADIWMRRADLPDVSHLPTDLPLIYMSHNPDAALQIPRTFKYDLMLAGHTHGGQILLPIPGLKRRSIPTVYPFDWGLHVMPRGNLVYVTPGTGMVRLPMRFRRPPQIDILTLTLPLRD